MHIVDETLRDIKSMYDKDIFNVPLPSFYWRKMGNEKWIEFSWHDQEKYFTSINASTWRSWSLEQKADLIKYVISKLGGFYKSAQPELTTEKDISETT